MSNVRQLSEARRESSGPRSASAERMATEIKGSIFALLALFELIALTSYLPIDSFNLFHGRLDHMNNMGGIVGAILGESFLGTTGIMGYSVIFLTAWLTFCAYRGKAIRDSFYQICGALLGTLLGSVACHLLFADKVAEVSLLQGGYFGHFAGGLLEHYFNTTGSLLLVLGGFLVTLNLTTGFSVARVAQNWFGEKDEVESDEDIQENVAPKQEAPAPTPAPVSTDAPAPKPKAKRSRKKKTEVSAEPTTPISTGDLETPAASEESDLIAASAPAAPKVFTCQELIPAGRGYSFPTPRLLKGASGNGKKLSKGEIKEVAQQLCEHLLSFQITGDIVSVSQGPVLTTFEFKPSAGVKLSKIAALQDDLGVVLGTRELRIVAPIPGKTVVGIELPKEKADTISLKEVLGEKEFHDKKIKIPVALGKTTDGLPAFGDLAAMPHLLVAGATGSGKSVFINSLIMSFLFRLSPDQLRLILVDPKMLELNVFDGIPHLITNVITDNKIAFNALSWAVWEMDRRYALMAKTGSKNIESYNEKQKGSDKLPFIVIVVDELADLMMSGGEIVEVAITRLAQKARAAGIHLVIATQRPSTDVITGLIKANIPSRISFKVPSGIDSRTILDTSGAEELIGRGDCLMIQPAVPLRRLHGTFVTEEDLKRVVKFVTGGKDHSSTYIDFSGENPDEK